jgi:hypothetical protein
MSDLKRISEQMINLGERLSDVVDAANGKGQRHGGGASRWVLLPAVGAGVYALARSEFMTRQAQGVVDEAKTRASDLPNELLNGVRHASQKTSGSSRPTSQRKKTTSTTRTASQRRRRASSARKSTSRS